jgi:hypothetical protein
MNWHLLIQIDRKTTWARASSRESWNESGLKKPIPRQYYLQVVDVSPALHVPLRHETQLERAHGPPNVLFVFENAID